MFSIADLTALNDVEAMATTKGAALASARSCVDQDPYTTELTTLDVVVIANDDNT